MQRSLRSAAKSIADGNVKVQSTSNANINPSISHGSKKRSAAQSIPSTSRTKRVRASTLTDDQDNGAINTSDNPAVTTPLRTNRRRSHEPTTPRRVEPGRTNVSLRTPGGTKLVPATTNVEQALPVNPLQTGQLPTTENVLQKACEHLISVDSRLKPIIEKHTCQMFTREGLAEVVDPFQSLVSGIMSQQVSGAAATSIKRKFINLFADEANKEPESDGQAFPQPSQIAAKTVPFLRQAGLSERKAEYIKGLAEQFRDGILSAQMLMTASDEEVLEKLTAVRGLGRWSVEMFSCFSLKRMDIFSTGDLGVQ